MGLFGDIFDNQSQGSYDFKRLRRDLENRLDELNMESRNLSDTIHEYLYNNANSTVRWANERLDEVRDEREYIEEYLSDLDEIVNSYLDEI